MSDPAQFLLFLAAAGALAVMPGPGLLYLTARALSEGRAVALRCCAGSFVGGLVHVAAGAAGLSALLLASSTAFTILKLAGGCYLLWLAWKTWHRAVVSQRVPGSRGRGSAAVQGFIVEATNPKTALFFLAFIPQFIEVEAGHVAMQFIALGVISVVLNTAAALFVICTAALMQGRIARHRDGVGYTQKGSALLLAALGFATLIVRKPQT
ncbi:LysE family translocator [Achromobacter animicus]|uniref:LysE family translocator n=1 Tax=Achromobacter animicus TaxID=1389935 RepID=UPI0028A71743|nr:LysE family translocator [Achromobacter animicus]